MLKKLYLLTFILIFQLLGFSQVLKETIPPYNIKTVSFIQNGQNVIPIFRFNDSFEFQFDDLYGNEANYYFKISHCNYDWKKSDLAQAEYIDGFNEQRIQNYQNSFNTLQVYSHYRLSFPNQFTRFLVSGNYLLSILDENHDVVFSRKFILYEDIVQVPMQVKRARNVTDINFKQNLEFSIKSKDITFQSPLTNVKVLLFQNGNFNTAITNIKPMYTIANDLIYKYDKETQFFGTNEYLFFENKDIRAASNGVNRIDSQGGIYNTYLFTNSARKSNPYTYFPDINGNFIIKNINAEQNDIEADYSWVYFTLSAPSYYGKDDIYITGMFNNNAMTDENRMEYNREKGLYEKAIMVKQGFYNFKYTLANKALSINSENEIDGNYYQTENNYFAIVYYRENNQRYDRVVGKGIATSTDIIN